MGGFNNGTYTVRKPIQTIVLANREATILTPRRIYVKASKKRKRATTQTFFSRQAFFRAKGFLTTSVFWPQAFFGERYGVRGTGYILGTPSEVRSGATEYVGTGGMVCHRYMYVLCTFDNKQTNKQTNK